MPAKIAAAVAGVKEECSRIAVDEGAQGHFSATVLTLDREPPAVIEQ